MDASNLGGAKKPKVAHTDKPIKHIHTHRRHNISVTKTFMKEVKSFSKIVNIKKERRHKRAMPAPR